MVLARLDPLDLFADLLSFSNQGIHPSETDLSLTFDEIPSYSKSNRFAKYQFINRFSFFFSIYLTFHPIISLVRKNSRVGYSFFISRGYRLTTFIRKCYIISSNSSENCNKAVHQKFSIRLFLKLEKIVEKNFFLSF